MAICIISFLGIIIWLIRQKVILYDQRDSLLNEIKRLEKEHIQQYEINNYLCDSLVIKLQNFYEQHELILCNDGKYRAKCTLEK